MSIKKRILITGASKGLGREIAFELASNDCELILVSRSKNLLNQIKKKIKNKNKHLFLDLDLLNLKNIKILTNQIKSVDAIIHCIGGSLGINEPFEDWNNFEKCLRGNLGIAVEINKYLIPAMIKKKKGNIIHIGSIVAQEATASVPYVTAKASLSAYVRTRGNYLAKYNVVLSGILPGAFFGKNNAMARFKFYKKNEYDIFVKNLPNQKMPNAKEYMSIIKELCFTDSIIYSGSLISLDAGQGKHIVQK